ncbi:MAG: hypothetical protein EI684_17315 [Candidatus Viridilinea halotolerans]|uniref:Uncharacterized protein n=1 Tax=Candidatus Viridilinea halotolerans TaxID=2491704 RepID=A0A426TU92_9CHLR|nr:MAG: hypothetical protein EI684_17315 [Candidatus Viridilinea halotolerans]
MSTTRAEEHAAWAEVDNITALISTIAWATPAWCYLERVAQDYLDPAAQSAASAFTHFDPATDYNLWERGRIFDATQELRWECNHTTFHAVYCGTTLPATMNKTALDYQTTRATSYYLWGQQVRPADRAGLGLPPDEAAFIELRIPRILRYPVAANARRAQIQIHELLAADGSLCYARWMTLQEA